MQKQREQLALSISPTANLPYSPSNMMVGNSKEKVKANIEALETQIHEKKVTAVQLRNANKLQDALAVSQSATPRPRPRPRPAHRSPTPPLIPPHRPRPTGLAPAPPLAPLISPLPPLTSSASNRSNFFAIL